MPSVLLGPKELLEYDADYGVIICRECQYAIQKSALQSHLLRHKIFRHERHSLLSSISQLNILEPEDVPLPPPTCRPIETLPVISGFRCTVGACESLYASAKRMRRHQLESHDLSEAEPIVRSVSLQTFFRGTKIRYFEVTTASAASEVLGILHKSFAAEGTEGRDMGKSDDQMRDTSKAAPPAVPVPSSKPRSKADINMQTLVYFHHFTSTTSLTLPPVNPKQPTALYWRQEFVTQALQQKWLMAGLLALSASHMGKITHRASAAAAHYDRSTEYIQEYLHGREKYTQIHFNTSLQGRPTPRKEVLDQIASVVSCARVLYLIQTLDPGGIRYEKSGEPITLESLILPMRSLVGNGPSLRPSGFPYSNNASDAFGRAAQLLNVTIHDPALSTVLQRLDTLPTRMASALGRPDDLQDVVIALSAIATLIDSCVAGFEAEEATFWAMATWLSKVGDEFHEMLARNNPAALIVLAHWAASLVRRVEETGGWFLKGAAGFVIGQVRERLPVDRPAIQVLVVGL